MVLNVKVLGMIFFFMVARWSWARFRYDQLMSLAWLVMLPLGMVNLAYVAVWEEYGGAWAGQAGFSPQVAMTVCGWAVLLATWYRGHENGAADERQPPPPPAAGFGYPAGFEAEEALEQMKADDTRIRWVDPPKLGMLGKSYLMLFIKGLTTALRHLFFHKKITLQSPEQRHEIRDPVNYRGVHRLNKDEQGRVKCVACFLCATACPAHCIDIVAEPSPWPDREKYPKVFNIDELRCIYLRDVRAGLSRRGDRVDELLRPDGVEPRGNDLRQGKALERFRPDQGPRADALESGRATEDRRGRQP